MLINRTPHVGASRALGGVLGLGVMIMHLAAALAPAQPYGEADRGQPGDAMIQEYLRLETAKVESDFLAKVKTPEDWERARPRYHQEYMDMLGLWPLPEKTPLHATVTGTLDRGDYSVDMVHYQSRPGLYVTANLYRPAPAVPARRYPAVLYVCGHSSRGRNGNKTAFQSHGIWLARHGYICLMVDTLQLGEIAGIHHGTYREGRWWWLSRGYTPAGVECWNGVRGLDYLCSRSDVDPTRLGVTGISGGGAATFWIAAADERVRAAAPVSGMADLASYVPNRVINGHCDCMFLYNTYQWPWTRIAALVAPRPLLFVNSDQDSIFPMDANERVLARLERLYGILGAGDVVDSVVSVGGHAYRQDIRQGVFRFLNAFLRDDPRPVADSEVDLVTGPREEIHPIAPETLRVFPKDSDIPEDAINAKVDREFVPMATAVVPGEGAFDSWRQGLVASLRRQTFSYFPERIPAATVAPANVGSILQLSTEPSISIRLRVARTPGEGLGRVWLLAAATSVDDAVPPWLESLLKKEDAVYVVELRGTGTNSWTRKNPPNYVERSHYLLGRTVDSGRVWDLVAAARILKTRYAGKHGVFLAGEGAEAVLAAYAAILEPEVSGLVLKQPPATHMDEKAPVLLNVLKVCDVPEAVGMVAPRPVTLLGDSNALQKRVEALYRAAGAGEALRVGPPP